MNKNQLELGREPIGKLLMKYSVPAIIGMLVNALYNVVDGNCWAWSYYANTNNSSSIWYACGSWFSN